VPAERALLERDLAPVERDARDLLAPLPLPLPLALLRVVRRVPADRVPVDRAPLERLD
jgi:hypothetical protein